MSLRQSYIKIQVFCFFCVKLFSVGFYYDIWRKSPEFTQEPVCYHNSNQHLKKVITFCDCNQWPFCVRQCILFCIPVECNLLLDFYK